MYSLSCNKHVFRRLVHVNLQLINNSNTPQPCHNSTCNSIINMCEFSCYIWILRVKDSIN